MSKHRDPHAAREAEKYDNPVPSREFLLQTLTDANKPVTFEDVCDILNETEEDRIEGIRRRLIAMARDAQIDSDRRRQTYFPLDPKQMVTGTLQGHKDGYGFLLRDDGEDVYISNNQMRKAFHGDKALVRITGTDRRGRLEGLIARVVEHNTKTLIGRLFIQDQDVAIVKPDNKRVSHEVIIAAEHRNNAQHDQFVKVEILKQPRPGQLLTGKVIEVIGDNLAPGMEIQVAIESHGIPHEWNHDIDRELKQIPDEVIESDKEGRIDLRDLPFVTIDGEDARDFDDAIYVERNKKTKGWRLFVAIADVSHYIQVNSALDKEAAVRATSVYFPDNVVPMLPEAISNGLCSLNPHVDRLVMVCEATISANGKLSGYKFYEGVIHSHARLTYNKVWDMLQTPLTDEGKALRMHHRALVPHIEETYSLFKTLRKVRAKRGAIDFETVETKIEFDSQRKIRQIVPTSRNDAHMIIEECMLAANVCAADFLKRYKVPGLYRVHGGPSEQKLEKLRAFLTEMGLHMPGTDEPSPAHYQELLKQVADRDDANLIQTVMLRSLTQAVYQPDNEGHFGLAFDAYAHFTSPIRRYPDLLVHRGIRAMIKSSRKCKHVERVSDDNSGRFAKALRSIIGNSKAKKQAEKAEQQLMFPYDHSAMETLGTQCSMAERRADDATRDVVDFLKCEYMQQHVGNVYEGTISAVTGFGLFVSLGDVHVEGLVHITNLNNDYYQFDAVKHRLVGERTRKSFRLGDSVWIQVASVSLDDRKIDFMLAAPEDTEQNSSQPRPAKKKRAPRRRSGSASESNSEQDQARDEGDTKPSTRKPRKRSPRKADPENKATNSEGQSAENAAPKADDELTKAQKLAKKAAIKKKNAKRRARRAKAKKENAENGDNNA